MIKKTILLVTAVMLAATSASYAETSYAEKKMRFYAEKKMRVTNESGTTYFYKVGNKIKKIAPGSSKSFPIPAGKKDVKIQVGTTMSGNTVQGEKKSFTLTKAEVKANPAIQTNPASGQSTDVSN